MTIISTASALRRETALPRLGGLGAPYVRPLYLLANPETASGGPTDQLEVGYPAWLGIIYARNPLLWLFLLFGSGWLGGYVTWVMLGKRKSRRGYR